MISTQPRKAGHPCPPPPPSPPSDELKAKQQQIWSSGDYNKIAAITVPVSESLVRRADPRPGDRVLDVATGTGHAALAAARRGAHVDGIDYVPALLDIARRRAAAEDLAVDFVEADAEDLPFADGSFDHVLSAIGVMFTADHERAAAELVRVTRPGGRISLASWTPTGFVGRLLKTVGAHVPPPAVAQSPTRWGVADTVRDLLGAGRRRRHLRQGERGAAVRLAGGVRRLLPRLLRPHPLGRGAAHRRGSASAAGRHGRARGRLGPGHRRRLRHRLGVPRRHRHPALTRHHHQHHHQHHRRRTPMYHLDPFGRLNPSSLDLSRAAAERHAHLQAIRERDDAPTHPLRAARRRRPQEWLRALVLLPV